MPTQPKPADYVLIDADKVYYVVHVERFGGGWLAYHRERAPPPPWWRRYLTAGFASARWAVLVWLVHKLATLYFEAMRPS